MSGASSFPDRCATLALALALALLVATTPALAGNGPLPSARPLLDAGTATQGEAEASAQELADLALFAADAAGAAADEVSHGVLDEQRVVVPTTLLVSLLDRTGETGVSIIDRLRITILGLLFGVEGQASEDTASLELALVAAQERTRTHLAPEAVPFIVETLPFPACTSDVQAALDAALPGTEIIVCPGTYEGPWFVRQHFVTLRSLQGPWATAVDASAGRGIVVEASLVTVAGFLVEGANGPGGTGILVGDEGNALADRLEGDVTGVTLRDNVLRHNTHAIVVLNALGTVILANEVRDSTAQNAPDVGAILVVSGSLEEDSVATVIAANNFINNASYAIRVVTPEAAPVTLPAAVAVLNHFGSETGPGVELVPGAGCLSADTPDVDGSCRNGVSAGVLLVGFAPTPW